MPRFALTLEYDGAPFSGWQRQRDLPSVQATVEAALRRLEPDVPTIKAAGRTDAGVHATGQVAHCDMSRAWEPFRLMEALNHHLKPAPVAVLDCCAVPEDWHARFSATERRYLYRMLCRRAPPVLSRGQVWHVKRAIDADAMREAAAHLIGHHDFTTFRSTECQAKSPLKTLDRIEIETVEVIGGVEVHARLAARSFLHNQVRSIMGSLERVGAGGWAPRDILSALHARDRAACGPVAPAQGLVMTGVSYDPPVFRTPAIIPTPAGDPRP